MNEAFRGSMCRRDNKGMISWSLQRAAHKIVLFVSLTGQSYQKRGQVIAHEYPDRVLIHIYGLVSAI
jgi:hypothetical protein